MYCEQPVAIFPIIYTRNIPPKMKAKLRRSEPRDEMGQSLDSTMPEENLLQDFKIT